MSLKKKKACCAFHREEKVFRVPREIICFQTCKRGMVCKTLAEVSKILLSCWHSKTLLILHHVYWPLDSFLNTVLLLILMSSVWFANLMIRSDTNPMCVFFHSLVMKSSWVTICSFNTVAVANQTYFNLHNHLSSQDLLFTFFLPSSTCRDLFVLSMFRYYVCYFN